MQFSRILFIVLLTALFTAATAYAATLGVLEPDSDPVNTSSHPFTDVQSQHYWSSTSYTDGSNNAWYVHLSSGSVGGAQKTFSFSVWPVRGGD